MNILIDSSVWILYFNKGTNSNEIEFLIDENLVVINEIVLTELVPFLLLHNQKKLVKLLHEIRKIPLVVNWEEISKIQLKCIKKGINGIGIPDLIIAQNAKENNVHIFSKDKHFSHINNVYPILLHPG